MKKNVVGTVFVLFAMFSCGKKEQKEIKIEEDIPAVKIAFVEQKSLSEAIESTGVLASKSEIKLAFKTGGMIKKMYINEGQSVKKGQLLAELDMSEIDAQVNQAKIGLKKAKRDYDRVKKLYEDEAATQTNLQDVTTAVDLAKQTVAAANFNQKLSKIYAPASGRILRKISEQGELITPFAPALILGTGESAFIVSVGLADRAIVRVKMGNKATVKLDAYPDETFLAAVTQIAQTVNPATGTYEVELQIKPNQHKMISGFVARASIQTAETDLALVLPITALIGAEEAKATVFVYEKESKTVKEREISIGKIVGNYVEIRSGLAENEAIVTTGSGFLRNGQQVKVVQ